MSVELGTEDKNVIYLNLNKSGQESSNNPNDTQYCTVSLHMNDVPLISRQDKYIVALTRFSVPLTEIPIIFQTSFEIYKWVDNAEQGVHKMPRVNGVPNGWPDYDAFETQVDDVVAGLGATPPTIDNCGRQTCVIPNSFTVYQFLDLIEESLGALADQIKIITTPDMRYVVMIERPDGHERLYLKMSQALFSMLQFQSGDSPITVQGAVVGADHNALNLVGRRFHAATYGDSETIGLAPGATTFQKHTAHMCAADISCHRRIVFISDLATKQERNVQNVYKKFLADYNVTNPTNFSYQIRDRTGFDPYDSADGYADHFKSHQATVTETLPSHRVYASANNSSGRWQMLSLPGPLHQIEVRAQLQIWNFETRKFELKPIPLPAGSLFSCKLIFVSKSEFREQTTDDFHK